MQLHKMKGFYYIQDLKCLRIFLSACLTQKSSIVCRLWLKKKFPLAAYNKAKIRIHTLAWVKNIYSSFWHAAWGEVLGSKHVLCYSYYVHFVLYVTLVDLCLSWEAQIFIFQLRRFRLSMFFLTGPHLKSIFNPVWLIQYLLSVR